MLMVSDSLQWLWTWVLMCSFENHVSGFGYYICHKKQGDWKVLPGWQEGLISHLSFQLNLDNKKKWALPGRAFWGRSCFHHTVWLHVSMAEDAASECPSVCVFASEVPIQNVVVFFPLTSLTKQTLGFQVKPVIINLIILCTAFDCFCILSLDPVINQSSRCCSGKLSVKSFLVFVQWEVIQQ